MARLLINVAAAAAIVVLCSAVAFTLLGHRPEAPSRVLIQLAHSELSVRASSFAPHAAALAEMADIQALSASVTQDDARALSEGMFEQGKFSLYGSHNNGSSASFSTKRLRSKTDDKQFFVQFSSRADVYTLAALAKFSGFHVVSHVQEALFVAIGSETVASKARRFPGVAWVQERTGADKLSGSVRLELQQLNQHSIFTLLRRRFMPSARASDSNPVVELIVQCWYDACGAAAVRVKPICPVVYVQAQIIEVQCAADVVAPAVDLLSGLVGVEHVEIKQRLETKNFAGRAIIGAGPAASSPAESLVLSRIDVSNSVIGVADSGINMNNCFFYDNGKLSGSRVVSQYVYNDCTMCGRCCTSSSPPGCDNAVNSCGNQIDQSSHGTHVCGTIAGSSAVSGVSAGNGIAAGAKLFFQDIENVLPDTACFRSGGCGGLAAPSQISNLFEPTYNAGARVHSNSWGCAGSSASSPSACNTYNSRTQSIDAYAYNKKDFLVLFAAGNDGRNAVAMTVSQTCKNCLVVGATQLSDSLFRGMKPNIDQGYHCRYSASTGCCADPLSCVQSTETSSPCCSFISATKMSLPCCPTAYTCASCSVESGNIRHPFNVATFSSRGTTLDDGRIKPDLVAPGEDILSAASPGRDSNGDLIPTNPNYCGVPSPTTSRTLSQSQNAALALKSGTSMATPLAAGAVEKIRQYFRQGYYPTGVQSSAPSLNPDESLLRAVILASARPLSGSGGVWTSGFPFSAGFSRFPIPNSAAVPDIFAGFGLPVLDQAVTMPGGTYKMFFTSETFQTSSGASAFRVDCSGPSIPVTLVLTWTDPPGSTSSKKQLVNDLDLIVLVPGSASSTTQLFGNMREYADSINVVERVVCACPASGFVTAIVAPGEPIKTLDQKWYLVANGPITASITKLGSVPAYNAGRIAAPSVTSTSCTSDSPIVRTLNFMPGRQWSGASSTWDNQLLIQSATVSLSMFARANRAAVALTWCSDCSSVSLSLGCSTVISGWTSASVSLRYIAPSSLLNAITTNCGAADSPCRRDPSLSAFDWAAFAPDICSSYTSCTTCASAAGCGWCPTLGTCKSGATSGSTDGQCVASSTWIWLSTACNGPPPTTTSAPSPPSTASPSPPPPSTASPSPPPPSTASPSPSPPSTASPSPPPPSTASPSPSPPATETTTAAYVFRIADRSFSEWTSNDTAKFESNVQALLKDAANVFRVINVRSGSVILDSQVTTTTYQVASINTIFTNPAVMQQLPDYGGSLAVAAVGSDSVCSGYATVEACISANCGWCRLVESCLPGTPAGATVPPGSSSTCTGDKWMFSRLSCVSLYVIGNVCLGVPAVTLYVIIAAAVLHVLQASLFVCVGRAKGFFSCGKFLAVSLVPVVGLAAWCLGRRKRPATKAEVGMHSLAQVQNDRNRLLGML